MAEPPAAGASPVPQALRHPPTRTAKAPTLVRRGRAEFAVAADTADAHTETALPGSAEHRLTVFLMTDILQRPAVSAAPHGALPPATRRATLVVLRCQDEVFGDVASDLTASRLVGP